MWTADEFVISLCHAQQQGNNSSSLCAMPNSKAITLSHCQTRCQPLQQRNSEARMPSTARCQHYHIVKEGDSHFIKVIWRQDKYRKDPVIFFHMPCATASWHHWRKANEGDSHFGKEFWRQDESLKDLPRTLTSCLTWWHDLFWGMLGAVRYHLSLHALCTKSNSPWNYAKTIQ